MSPLDNDTGRLLLISLVILQHRATQGSIDYRQQATDSKPLDRDKYYYPKLNNKVGEHKDISYLCVRVVDWIIMNQSFTTTFL